MDDNILCMGKTIMQTYAIAFNSTCALSTISDPSCQSCWTTQQRALSLVEHVLSMSGSLVIYCNGES